MANTTQFQRSMQRVQSTMKNVGDSMQRIGKQMTASITLPLLAIGGAALKSAMDLEATESKYNVVFAGMTEAVDEFIRKFQELTPATTAAARNMASGIQDLLVPLGFMREEATAMTGEFLHVIGALSNFNSGTHTSEQVANAFQSAITGMYMPLKRLGIQLDETTVKNKAVEMGLTDSTKNVTKQMKAVVLLKEVYAQSGDALAGYTKEALDTKTKLLLLTARLKDIGAELATRFLPYIVKAMEKIREWAEAFANLSPKMRNIILIVAGIAAAIGPLILIAGMLISSIGAIAGVLGAITAPSLGVVASIGAVVAVLMTAWNKSILFRNTVKKVWGQIYKTISKIAKSIMGIVKTLWEFLKDFWDEFGALITVTLGTILATVGDVFSGIGTIISGALDIINGTLGIFLSLLTGNWEKAWEGIISITKGALKVINGLLKALGIDLKFMQNAIDSLGGGNKKKTVKFEAKAFTTNFMGKDNKVNESLAGTIFGGAAPLAPKKKASALDDLMKRLSESLTDGGADFDDFADTGVSAFDKLNDATQRYVDTLKSQIDTFKTAFGIFDKPQIERISGERLLVRMEAQTKVFEKWQNALEVLRQKLGANSKLFQTLAQQGPSAMGQIVGMAGLSVSQLQQAEGFMSARGNIATNVATGLTSQQMRAEQSAPTVNLNGGVYVGDMAELANLISRELKLSGVN